VRVVRLEGGTLTVARSSVGRGAWLCRDSPACIDRAESRKAFERALRGRVDGRQVDEIRSALGTGSHEMAGPGSESPVL
jgi:predicted RNA-binding protein YlxR (DUF448 family)